MTDILKITKKVFTVGVVATTIMWSVGVAALVPAVANAAVCPTLVSGDMIKVTGKPAIYVLDANGKYRYFADGDVFKSWNADDAYGKYYTAVSQECFDSLSQPSAAPYHVSYRPGSTVVKYLSGDTLYVVKPNNTLQPITDEAAKVLYGTDYSVRTIGLSEWPYYTKETTTITEAKAHAGMVVMNGSKYWYVNSDNKLQEVTATGLTANRLRAPRTVADSVVAGLVTDSTMIDAATAVLTERVTGTSVATPVGGSLSVSLAADTPNGVQAAKGSIYNDVFHFNLQGGAAAAQVTGVTLQKLGLLSNTHLTGISVWVDGVRYGSIATALDDNGKVSIGFGNTPIEVPAGMTKTVMVKVNVSASADATNFQMGVAEVESNGSVGGLPIYGNYASVIAGTLASYTVTAGTVSGYANESTAQSSSNDGQLEIGDMQKEIGKWTFAESGNEDVKIENLTFFIQGTLDDENDLQNWTVYGPANEVLGVTKIANDRYVTVPVNYTLKKGYSKTLTLKADALDGSNKYFAVSLQNDYDIVAKGLNTGYYVAPSSFTEQTPTNAWFKMKQGTLSVQRAATSPSAALPAGSTDAVLGVFELKAIGEDVEIRKMALEIYSGDANDPDMTGNVKVQSEDGNTTYLSTAYTNLIDGSTSGATFATGTQRDLSTYLTISSGATKKIRVVGNLGDGANSTDTYLVKVGKFYLKRLSTLDYQTKPNATTAYTGNTLTVNAASLTVSKNTSIGDHTRSTGAADEIIGSFLLTGGASEDVNVTNIALDITNSSNVTNVGLWDGTTPLGTEVVTPVASSNTYSFSYPVPKNVTKVIHIKADVATTASSTSVCTISSLTATGALTGQSAYTSSGVTALQTTTFAAARLYVSNDTAVTSKILLPSVGDTKALLATHKYEAANANIELRKVTYVLLGESSTTTEGVAADLGTIELRDSTGAVLASASPVDSGSTTTVTFTGFNHIVNAGTVSRLSLYGHVNEGGIMTPASTNRLAVYSDSSSYIEAYASTGLLARSAIGYDSSNYADNNDYFSASNNMLYHVTAPTLALHASSPSGTKTPSSESELFRFTVLNPGNREMRLGSTSVYISEAGMHASGSLRTFSLYDGSTLLAQDTTTIMGSSTESTSIVFNTSNDTSNNWLANYVISPGETKTFKVTADTSAIRTGLTSGQNAYVTASLDGATGYDSTADASEDNWANGVITYFYTPSTGGTENTDEYTASDSYDVIGNTLSF